MFRHRMLKVALRKLSQLYLVLLRFAPANSSNSSMLLSIDPAAHPHSPGGRLLPDSKKTLEEELHAEIGHGRSEKHGTLLAGENTLHI